MNRVLRVYWRHYKMSKNVASKGNWMKKEYRKKNVYTDFPPDTDPKEAYEQIHEKHGYRPDTPLHCEHSFADIDFHCIFVKAEPSNQSEEKTEEQKLL